MESAFSAPKPAYDYDDASSVDARLKAQEAARIGERYAIKAQDLSEAGRRNVRRASAIADEWSFQSEKLTQAEIMSARADLEALAARPVAEKRIEKNEVPAPVAMATAPKPAPEQRRKIDDKVNTETNQTRHSKESPAVETSINLGFGKPDGEIADWIAQTQKLQAKKKKAEYGTHRVAAEHADNGIAMTSTESMPSMF
jgi:hypothetical protein